MRFKRPLNQTVSIIEALAAGTLHHGEHHLDVAIVAAFVTYYHVNGLGRACYGVAHGFARGVVALSVNGKIGLAIAFAKCIEGFNRDGGTLARGHLECSALVQLAPVGPASVVELAGIGREGQSHVDGLAVHFGLSHPYKASHILPLNSGGTILALEVPLQGYFCRAVGQIDCVGREDRSQGEVALRGDGFACCVGIAAVSPARQCVAFFVKCEVGGNGNAFAVNNLTTRGQDALGRFAAQRVADSILFDDLVQGFHGNEGAIAHARNGQRGGLTCVGEFGHVVVVVLPAGCGRGLARHRFADTVGNLNLVAAVGTLTNQNGDVALNGDNHFHAGESMVTVIIATDGSHRRGIARSHTAHSSV